MLKIWRSPYSRFAGEASNFPDEMTDETITADAVYTDAELSRIAASGFNAIWIHGLLHHLIKVSPLPELGLNEAIHLRHLRQLQRRAEAHGIKLFIYLQPPRAIEISLSNFWTRHADIAGRDIEFYNGAQVRTLCTSTSQVQKWLTNASRRLVQALPGLGGVILITASEFPSHCLNIPGSTVCQRCKDRSTAEVIAEIINCINNGVKSVNPDTCVLAWNWGWEEKEYEEIIGRLSQNVILMGDFERGGKRELPDHSTIFYDEYSLSFAGPSERFLDLRCCAEKHGHEVVAKLQLGTTHELASVVSLPLIGSIYEKAAYLRNHPCSGYLGCWNFGNMQSSNINAFHFFLENDILDNKKNAMNVFAKAKFPKGITQSISSAWETFANAMLYYPFSIPFLYYGPQNYTLAYGQIYKTAPLEGTPSGRTWHFDERGDDLSLCYGNSTPEQILTKMEKVSEIWQSGIRLLDHGLADKYPLELGNAIIVGAVWESTINTLKITKLRRDWDETQKTAFFDILEMELSVLKNVLPWVKRDSRQGYHSEPGGYMFNVQKIVTKIAALEIMKER